MRNKIYQIVKWVVIISFVYLFIFENKYNIDQILMNVFKCSSAEVVHFKVVIIIIITLVIMIINRILEKCSYVLDLSIKEYIKLHPIRSITIFIIILEMILLGIFVLIQTKNFLIHVIYGLLIFFSGIIGFYIGQINRQ